MDKDRRRPVPGFLVGEMAARYVDHCHAGSLSSRRRIRASVCCLLSFVEGEDGGYAEAGSAADDPVSGGEDDWCRGRVEGPGDVGLIQVQADLIDVNRLGFCRLVSE